MFVLTLAMEVPASWTFEQRTHYYAVAISAYPKCAIRFTSVFLGGKGFVA